MNEDITQALSMLFNSVKATGGQLIMIVLEEEVEYVLSHITIDKGSGWDDIMNEFFKSSVPELKGPLAMIF